MQLAISLVLYFSIFLAAVTVAVFWPRYITDISSAYDFGPWNSGQNAYGYIYKRFGSESAFIYLALGGLIFPSVLLGFLCAIPVFAKLYDLANGMLNDGRALLFTVAAAAVFLFFALQALDPSHLVRTLGDEEYLVLVRLWWQGVAPVPLAGLALLIGICVLFGRFMKMGAER